MLSRSHYLILNFICLFPHPFTPYYHKPGCTYKVDFYCMLEAVQDIYNSNRNKLKWNIRHVCSWKFPTLPSSEIFHESPVSIGSSSQTFLSYLSSFSFLIYSPAPYFQFAMIVLCISIYFVCDFFLNLGLLILLLRGTLVSVNISLGFYYFVLSHYIINKPARTSTSNKVGV